MNTTQASTKSPEFIAALCHELVVLARHQEDVAATEAARAPYWSPYPASVDGHRAAAHALRADVARLERELRGCAQAS